MNITLFRIAAVLCLGAVGLGAFGAHSLKSVLATRDMVGVWEKAVLYQFIHAVGLLALSLVPHANRPASMLLLAGIALFSGSLYALALTNARWLGVVTPIGGVCFLAGWAWLAVAPTR